MAVGIVVVLGLVDRQRIGGSLVASRGRFGLVRESEVDGSVEDMFAVLKGHLAPVRLECMFSRAGKHILVYLVTMIPELVLVHPGSVWSQLVIVLALLEWGEAGAVVLVGVVRGRLLWTTGLLSSELEAASFHSHLGRPSHLPHHDSPPRPSLPPPFYCHG